MWGEGGRPARRRWWDVTASGIWGGVSGFVSWKIRLFGFGEGGKCGAGGEEGSWGEWQGMHGERVRDGDWGTYDRSVIIHF